MLMIANSVSNVILTETTLIFVFTFNSSLVDWKWKSYKKQKEIQ